MSVWLIRCVAVVLLLAFSGAAPALAMALAADDACCPGEDAEEDDDDDDGCCFACVDCAHSLSARPMLPAAHWVLPPARPSPVITRRDPSPHRPQAQPAAGVDDDVFHPPRR